MIPTFQEKIDIDKKLEEAKRHAVASSVISIEMIHNIRQLKARQRDVRSCCERYLFPKGQNQG